MKNFDLYKLRREYSSIELAKLWVNYNAGDMQARKNIITGSMYLVHDYVDSLCLDNMNIKLDKDDLYSVGYIGLIKAVDNFDLIFDTTFFVFARKCIINEINDYFRKINRKKHQLQIIDDESYNIQDSYDDKELLFKLYDYFDELDDKSKMAMRLYYGFNGNDEHIVKEVAEIMGITYGQARHLIEKSIKFLRNKLLDNGYNSANVTNIRQYCKKYF